MPLSPTTIQVPELFAPHYFHLTRHLHALIVAGPLKLQGEQALLRTLRAAPAFDPLTGDLGAEYQSLRAWHTEIATVFEIAEQTTVACSEKNAVVLVRFLESKWRVLEAVCGQGWKGIRGAERADVARRVRTAVKGPRLWVDCGPEDQVGGVVLDGHHRPAESPESETGGAVRKRYTGGDLLHPISRAAYDRAVRAISREWEHEGRFDDSHNWEQTVCWYLDRYDGWFPGETRKYWSPGDNCLSDVDEQAMEEVWQRTEARRRGEERAREEMRRPDPEVILAAVTLVRARQAARERQAERLREARRRPSVAEPARRPRPAMGDEEVERARAAAVEVLTRAHRIARANDRAREEARLREAERPRKAERMDSASIPALPVRNTDPHRARVVAADTVSTLNDLMSGSVRARGSDLTMEASRPRQGSHYYRFTVVSPAGEEVSLAEVKDIAARTFILAAEDEAKNMEWARIRREGEARHDHGFFAAASRERLERHGGEEEAEGKDGHENKDEDEGKEDEGYEEYEEEEYEEEDPDETETEDPDATADEDENQGTESGGAVCMLQCCRGSSTAARI